MPESNATPPPTPSDVDWVAAVYSELRALAARKLAQEHPGQTLQATALVHEAWLKLRAGSEPRWNSPTHFYAAAARAMRQILIDNARRKQTARHGGGWLRIDHPDFDFAKPDSPADTDTDTIEALCAALDRLEVSHPTHAELVQLRFFTGLSLREAAAALGFSEPTAKRYWAFARAWLFRELRRGSTVPPSLPDARL